MRSSTATVHGDTVQVVAAVTPVGASTVAIMWSAPLSVNWTWTVRDLGSASPPSRTAGHDCPPVTPWKNPRNFDSVQLIGPVQEIF